MKKIIISVAVGGFFAIIGSVMEAVTGIAAILNHNDSTYMVNMKRDLLCLMMAYPDHIKGIDARADGRVYIRMNSGKRILYDDKIDKSTEEKINNPDLQDMLQQVYPLGPFMPSIEQAQDPGRIRVYSLLNEVYGTGKHSIEKNLININLVYNNCQFNKNNAAAESLRNVSRDLVGLMQKNNKVRAYVFPLSGTFNYRLISETRRLSPHSYGIAIDLSKNNNDYWKWCTIDAGQKRIDSYPKDLVQLFEKNYFVWGGKWKHFDILHFEYRPEIIIKAKYFNAHIDEGKPWYDKFPIEDKTVKTYIEVIESALG